MPACHPHYEEASGAGAVGGNRELPSAVKVTMLSLGVVPPLTALPSVPATPTKIMAVKTVGAMMTMSTTPRTSKVMAPPRPGSFAHLPEREHRSLCGAAHPVGKYRSWAPHRAGPRDRRRGSICLCLLMKILLNRE